MVFFTCIGILLTNYVAVSSMSEESKLSYYLFMGAIGILIVVTQIIF